MKMEVSKDLPKIKGGKLSMDGVKDTKHDPMHGSRPASINKKHDPKNHGIEHAQKFEQDEAK